MTIDQALAEIMTYSVAHGVDSLGAIELMVKNYKNLPVEQRLAVDVFMAATKEPA
jgi:acyl carrier protein